MSINRGFDRDLVRRNRDIVRAFNMYKQGSRCKRCGENHPGCLMFYDKSEKVKVSITYARSNWHDMDDAFRKFERCDCYCSNCFAKKYERPGGKAQGLKAWIAQYKKDHGCVECNESDPVCLEFHHRDPSEKETNISDCKTKRSALKEIEKCEILCLNCHDKLHWEEEKLSN